MAQWIKSQPVNGKVTSSVPGQSTHMPGFPASSPVGGVREATNLGISHTGVSLSLFLLYSVVLFFFRQRAKEGLCPLSKSKYIKS